MWRNPRKKINQDISDIDGDVVAPIVSDVSAGRDVNIHIGKDVSMDSLKKQGFDIGINPIEHLMIKLGRLLWSKLGAKKFLAIFGSLFLGPLGLIIYEMFMLQQNLTYNAGTMYDFSSTGLRSYFLALF